MRSERGQATVEWVGLLLLAMLALAAVLVTVGWRTVRPSLRDAVLATVYSEYGRLYEEFYGYRLDRIPIELVRLSVVVTGTERAFPRLPGVPDVETSEPVTRPVFFPGHGFVETAIMLREQLAPGATIAGPAIVEYMDSTAVVPPEWLLTVLPNGILEVTRP